MATMRGGRRAVATGVVALGLVAALGLGGLRAGSQLGHRPAPVGQPVPAATQALTHPSWISSGDVPSGALPVAPGPVALLPGDTPCALGGTAPCGAATLGGRAEAPDDGLLPGAGRSCRPAGAGCNR
jgi:hypothetical protein